MLLLNASNNVRVGRYQDCERLRSFVWENKTFKIPIIRQITKIQLNSLFFIPQLLQLHKKLKQKIFHFVSTALIGTYYLGRSIAGKIR